VNKREPTRDWSRFALLLIDLQHDFWPASLAAQFPDLPANVERLLSRCRAEGIEVVHVRSSFRADSTDWMVAARLRGSTPCVEGTPGAEPLPFAREAPGEAVFLKQSYDAFQSCELAAHLRPRQMFSADRRHADFGLCVVHHRLGRPAGLPDRRRRRLLRRRPRGPRADAAALRRPPVRARDRRHPVRAPRRLGCAARAARRVRADRPTARSAARRRRRLQPHRRTVPPLERERGRRRAARALHRPAPRAPARRRAPARARLRRRRNDHPAPCRAVRADRRRHLGAPDRARRPHRARRNVRARRLHPPRLPARQLRRRRRVLHLHPPAARRAPARARPHRQLAAPRRPPGRHHRGTAPRPSDRPELARRADVLQRPRRAREPPLPRGGRPADRERAARDPRAPNDTPPRRAGRPGLVPVGVATKPA
jgi:hypothetical protein